MVYAPFWNGVATLTALQRGQLFTNSLASSIKHVAQPLVGEATAIATAQVTCAVLLCLLLARLLWLAALTRDSRQAVSLSYWAMLSFMFLGVTWFQPWYVVWPAALAAVLPVAARHREIMLLSAGAMSTYLVWIYLWWMDAIPGGIDVVRHVAYVTLIGPLLIGWAIGAAGRITFRRRSFVPPQRL
jgi:hypothetical protein